MSGLLGRGSWRAAALWAALAALAGPASGGQPAGAAAPKAAPLTIDVPDACAALIRKECPLGFADAKALRTCLDQPSNHMSGYCRKNIEAQLPGGPSALPPRVAAKPKRKRPAHRPHEPANAAQARAAALSACRAETGDFCSDVPRTQPDILACLKAYKSQLSERCGASLDLVRWFEDAQPAAARSSR